MGAYDAVTKMLSTIDYASTTKALNNAVTEKEATTDGVFGLAGRWHFKICPSLANCIMRAFDRCYCAVIEISYVVRFSDISVGRPSQPDFEAG